MENKLISIIVPVYNVEKYLSACIDSILCQTYQDFELLLIDDGSVDRSLQICNSYMEKDSRVKVYHHENHGVGYTRNLGIEISAGEYITFVDADDLILPKYLENLLQLLLTAALPQSTISICPFYRLQNNGEKIEFTEKYEHLAPGRKNLKYIIEDVLLGRLFGSCCRILIPASLVKANNVFFPQCKIREDQLFLFDIANCTEEIIVSRECLYLYRDNPDSACNRYIEHCVADQSKYLKVLNEKLTTFFFDDEVQNDLFSYAVLNVQYLWIRNATNSDNYYKEINTIKNSEYYTYSLSKRISQKWINEDRKTRKIIYTLAKGKMYFLICCLYRLKRMCLHRF